MQARLFLLSSRVCFGRRDASGSKTTGAIFYCDQSAATAIAAGTELKLKLL